MDKPLSGPEFKKWADASGIDRKVMAHELEVSEKTLYTWFQMARFKRFIARALRSYANEKSRGET